MASTVGIYRSVSHYARHRGVCVLAIFAFTLTFRLLLSFVLPHPQPSSHDEFAYLLGADLFANGHIAGQTHPLWKFFESVQVISSPAYAPKYPPAQAAFLAFGQLLFHDPFYGVLLSVALFSAAMCWMLQAYLRPVWALLGGVCTALYFGAGHYWTEMYWGGAVAGLGAALFIGAFARLLQSGGTLHGFILGTGALLLLNSRPYESSLLLLVLSSVLLIHFWKQRHQKSFRSWMPAAAGLALALSSVPAYNYAVTGDPLKMPYLLYMDQYASAPQFWIQDLPKEKHYENAALQWSAERYDIAAYNEIHSLGTGERIYTNLLIIFATVLYDGGVLAFAPLLFLPWCWKDPRVRLFGTIAILLLAAIMPEVVVLLHYLAPLIVVGILLSLLAIERIWKMKKMPCSDRVLLVSVLTCTLLAGPVWRAGRAAFGKTGQLYRGDEFGFRRARVAESILSQPGHHVVFVRFNREQSPEAAWVANGADVDSARLVWAHDRGDENVELEKHFPGRTFWLLEDKRDGIKLQPYHSPLALSSEHSSTEPRP